MAQRPHLVAEMDLRTVDPVSRIWHSRDRYGRDYPVPLTRLVSALISHGLALRGSAGGHLLFPGRKDTLSPITTAMLSRVYRSASGDRSRWFRRTSDVPFISAVIMTEARVDPKHIRVVLRRPTEYDRRNAAKFFRFESWVEHDSRIALEQLEASLMRIVGMKYSDPLFSRTISSELAAAIITFLGDSGTRASTLQ